MNRYRALVAALRAPGALRALGVLWALGVPGALGGPGSGPAARAADGAVDPKLVAEIKQGAADTWHRATTRAYVSREQSESTDTATGKVRSRVRTRTAVDGKNYLSVREPENVLPTASKGSAVHAVNPAYSFRLVRKADAPDWALTGWLKAGETNPTFKPIEYAPERAPVFAHLTFLDKPLFQALDDPNCKVSKTEPSPAAPGCVRLHLTYSDKSKPRQVRTQGGWLDLDRAAGWCIKGGELRTETKIDQDWVSTGEFTKAHQYATADGVPVLARIENVGRSRLQDGSKDEREEFRFVTEFETAYRDSVPVTEFTLSAFGLPEPQGVTWARPTPTYVWFVAGAVGFGLLAVVLRVLARRSGAAPAG